MIISEMLGQSSILAVLGVVMVFGFLLILVLAISAMGKILGLKRLNKGLQTADVHAGMDNKAQVTAAITAAVAQYKNRS